MPAGRRLLWLLLTALPCSAAADPIGDAFEVTTFPDPGRTVLAEIADFDGDGRRDLLQGVIRGIPPAEERLLRVRLQGADGRFPDAASFELPLPDGAAAYDLADLRDTERPTERRMRSIQALTTSKYADELKSPRFEGRYFNNLSIVDEFEAAIGDSEAGREGLQELRDIVELTSSAGYGSQRIRIDPSVVRGLEYYTSPVFEAELTQPVKDERGIPIRLGSVVSGGRYEGLVERFTGEKVPATGLSIGVSRCLSVTS